MPRKGFTVVMNRFRNSVYVLALALPTAILAQDTRPPRPNENVKVLTEVQGPALRAEMQRISAALGVKCDHCHVQGNFASDEKSPKRTARRMIEMTRGLNAQFFPKHQPREGDSVLGRVTCYTCHQGAESPKSAPPAAG
jgi:photosynthetic reaction center cytochrome c subunit